MNTSSLYPPNCQAFSEQAIGDVVQRVDCCYQDRLVSPIRISLNEELCSSTGTGSARLSDPGSYQQTAEHPAADVSVKSTSQILAEQALERHRKQCRVNMARYRKKMKARVANLETTTQALRDEVRKLELHLQLCGFAFPTTRTCWDAVSGYFRLFHYAPKNPTMMQSPCSNAEALCLTRFHGHRTFLATTMSPDVITASGRGVDVLLEDYTRISLYLPDLHVELVSMHSKAEDTVLATTHVKATITERTLQLAFPHLVNDPELWTTLGSKLLDKRLVMRGSVHFIWDADIGRVVSLRSQVDFLTPMITILGDLADVARVFEHSLINPDGTLAPQLPPMTDSTRSFL